MSTKAFQSKLPHKYKRNKISSLLNELPVRVGIRLAPVLREAEWALTSAPETNSNLRTVYV